MKSVIVQKRLFFFVRIIISVGAVGIVLSMFRGRWDDVFLLLKRVKWSYVLLSFFMLVLSQSFLAVRLKEILKVQDVVMSFQNLFSLTMIALFFNNFLPSAIGGDVVKAYYTGRQSQKKLEPWAAVFADRAIGFVTLIMWSVAALWFYRYHNGFQGRVVIHSVRVLSVVALCLILFFFSRRISGPYHWVVRRLPFLRVKQALERLYNGVNAYRSHPRLVILAVVISAAAQFSTIVIHWVLARGMGFPISIGILMLVLPIIAVAQNAPSINGMGIREGAYVFFLSEYLTKEGALALSVLFYIVYLTVSLCGGMVYAMRGGGLSLVRVSGGGK